MNDSQDSTGPTASASPAGLLRRLAAMTYDVLLVVAVWMIGTAALLPLTGGETIEGVWRLLFQLYVLALTFAFFALFWLHGGQTLGMKAWRIYVERADGGAMTLKDAALRFLAAIPSLLPAGVGLLWCVVDRQHQAMHDRLSRTRVVHRPRDA
ncbi:MAG: RDD family protein [Aquisalimonadaceae bacterium]